MGVLMIALVLIPFGVLVGVLFSSREHWRWGRRLVASEQAGLSAYRASAVVTARDAREPWVVRGTAALTGFLGGMLFPGGLMGLVGMFASLFVLSDLTNHGPSPEKLLVLALGASVPTGLVIAFRCLTLYRPMIENRGFVTERMRSLGRFTAIHNLVVFGVYVAFVLAKPDAAEVLWLTSYNLVSLAHAGLLFRSATVIDLANAEHERYELAAEQRGALVDAAS